MKEGIRISIALFALTILGGCPAPDTTPPQEEDFTPPGVPEVTGLTPAASHYVTWLWTSTDDAVKFRYRRDSFTVWNETTASFYSSSYLDDGVHTLYVQAADAAGNWSESGAFDITVDTSIPSAPSVTGPEMSENRTPTWIWGAIDGADIYRYQLNGILGEWVQTTELSFTPDTELGFGPNVLYVQARNAAGTWSSYGSHAIEICKEFVGITEISEYCEFSFNDTADQWAYFDAAGGNMYRIYWNDNRYPASGFTGRLKALHAYHDDQQTAYYSSYFPDNSASTAVLLYFPYDERVYFHLQPQQQGTIGIQIDDILLQYPENITADTEEGEIRISWEEFSSGDTDGDGLRDIDGYVVYKSEDDSDFSLVDDTVYNVNYLVDDDFYFVTDYYYKVLSYVQDNDYMEHFSVLSPSVHHNVPITEYKPAVPSASDDNTDAVTISWNLMEGIDAFRIYRSESSDDDYVQLGGDIDPSLTEIEDSDSLTAETTYYYKLSVVIGGDESMLSEPADGYIRKYGPDEYENDDTAASANEIELSSLLEYSETHTLDGYDFPLSGGDHFRVYNRTGESYKLRITFTGIDLNGNEHFYYYKSGSTPVSADETVIETSTEISPNAFHSFNVSSPSRDRSMQYTIMVELFSEDD